MIAALDVDYRDETAQAAAVVFGDWADGASCALYKTICHGVAPYESGAFYKRELPCLLEVLKQLPAPPACIVIDGFVWLDDSGRKGLGAHLFEALGGRIPIIGVAKTQFAGAHLAARVLRGSSKQPLLITTCGMPVELGVANILSMHGDHRIPTLLRLTDQSCRTWARHS